MQVEPWALCFFGRQIPGVQVYFPEIDGIDAVLLQAEKSAWALEKANYEREKQRLSSELDSTRRQLASADRRLEAYQSDAAVDGPFLCPSPRSKHFALALEAGAISGHFQQ